MENGPGAGLKHPGPMSLSAPRYAPPGPAGPDELKRTTLRVARRAWNALLLLNKDQQEPCLRPSTCNMYCRINTVVDTQYSFFNANSRLQGRAHFNAV